MIPELRKKYNSTFSQRNYEKLVSSLDDEYGYKVDFRIAETPVFLPKSFRQEVINAAETILSYIQSDKYMTISHKAIPEGMKVPGETKNPELMAFDFAICKDENGDYIPQLIELQGFPSLYCYQELLNMKVHQYFDIPLGFTNFFSGLNHDSYIQLLKDTVVGKSNPENVILLEIEPEEQKTRIDFSATEKWLGVKAVCLSDIIKAGKDLFYRKDGKTIQIEKIYNRVIFDELSKRTDLKYDFSFQDELNVKWIPHPDWFFRISKFTMPYLKNKYVPDTRFLSDVKDYPTDLENYVLKPLFSFAGVGVKIDVTKEILDEIKDKENYILQKKIVYEPVIETPDVPAKAELRLLFVWNDKPMLVNNLVRLTKGKMVGVDYNKDKIWVGSSIAYFEQ